jgi:hypothetical protein
MPDVYGLGAAHHSGRQSLCEKPKDTGETAAVSFPQMMLAIVAPRRQVTDHQVADTDETWLETIGNGGTHTFRSRLT